jgi:hypothetical protein
MHEMQACGEEQFVREVTFAGTECMLPIIKCDRGKIPRKASVRRRTICEGRNFCREGMHATNNKM